MIDELYKIKYPIVCEFGDTIRDAETDEIVHTFKYQSAFIDEERLRSFMRKQQRL